VARELSIGELSERSGVTQSALRFYERQGLIAARRTEGNQRRYPSVTLRRVALVQAGKAAGVPLERVREALDVLPDGTQPTKRDWERLSSAWRAELDERIATLQSVRDRLTTCIGCGCLSLQTCRLLNPDDEAASLGGGAHYLRRVSPRGRGLAQRDR
jgi:MerR family redox-sensitive transcriptional activator SoxR